MKKILAGILLVLLVTSDTNAQAPQLYAELGGPSVAGINFDTRFAKKENGIGGRLGIGGFAIDGVGYRYQPKEPGVTFRVSVNPFFAFKNAVFWPFYGGISVGYKFK